MKKKSETEEVRILRSIFRKRINPEPWIEWFGMLQTYVEAGLLEVQSPLSEAYITEPALYTLSNLSDELLSIAGRMRGGEKVSPLNCAIIMEGIKKTVERIGVYSMFLNRAEEGYKKYLQSLEAAHDNLQSEKNATQAADNLQKPGTHQRTFALHVVESNSPHNLIYTIVIQRKRHWWWPFNQMTDYNIISYK